MEMQSILSSIVGWFRAGYPHGIPEADYVPLFALLTRRLSDDEVKQITGRLVEEGILPIDKTDIQVMITKVTDEMPLETDVQRVLTHLQAGGWPITGIDPDGAGTK
jgi:hypothetical protein